MINHQDFDQMPPRSYEIDRNMFLYGSHLENPIWFTIAAFLCSTVIFPDSENICLDTKISLIWHLEAEIIIEMFHMVAILKIQYGHHKHCEKNALLNFGYSTSESL